MQKSRIMVETSKPFHYLYADLIAIFLVIILLTSLIQFVDVSGATFVETVTIDTSLGSIPRYAALSLTRCLIALMFSYAFALVYGKIAATNARAERLMIPLVDVLQSLPVLAFLPGFVLTLITLFHGSRWGLEIACILLVFTGQVWNLVFAYYESQKTLRDELKELAKVENLSFKERFLWIDVPNGVRPLVFNGMMSMAGGWFFVTLCESFVLGQREFTLPGLGSYLSATFQNGQYTHFGIGTLALFLIIVGVDVVLWSPLIAWSQRFKETEEEEDEGNAWFMTLLEKSVVPNLISRTISFIAPMFHWLSVVLATFIAKLNVLWRAMRGKKSATRGQRMFGRRDIIFTVTGVLFFYFLPEVPKLGRFMSVVSEGEWKMLSHSLFMTLAKVMGVLFISTLWTIPVGLYIGKSEKLSKRFQPFIQNLAAFPAPILYPLIVTILHGFSLPAGLIATLLMTIGNQWYMLFNVISGASRIPLEVVQVARTFDFNVYERVTKIYIPAILPSLITGWMTAAGGAWNASIVAEIVTFPGGTLRADGIGAAIADATTQGKYPQLIAAVVLVSGVLVILNRSVWHPLQNFAEKVKV